MATCHIALGGNVGDVFATMERGLDLLNHVNGITVQDVSHAYLTKPVGKCAGGDFLNAAAALDCSLSAFDLLKHLKAVEEAIGRHEDARWGPRLLDLDLLLFGDDIINEHSLTVPQPHLWYRRFVLDPLADIASEAVHPLHGQTIRSLLDCLDVRPLPIVLIGRHPDERRTLFGQLAEFKQDVTFHDVSSTSALPEHPASLSAIILVFDKTSEYLDIFSEDESIRQIPWHSIKQSDLPRMPFDPATRCINLSDLPGTSFDAAKSVLTAALDKPVRQSRPLRRMP